MRKHQIQSAALEVATQVRAVEHTIDQALQEIAELQSRMIRAHSTAGVGVNTGHEALEQLVVSVQALVTARGGMGNCHLALVDARQKVPGLRTVAFGDEECPEQKTAFADLRVVA